MSDDQVGDRAATIQHLAGRTADPTHARAVGERQLLRSFNFTQIPSRLHTERKKAGHGRLMKTTHWFLRSCLIGQDLNPENTADMEKTQTVAEQPHPAPTRRYRVEVCFLCPDDENAWSTVTSFDCPFDALRRCSECLESAKDLFGIPFGQNIEDEDYIRIRIYDTEAKRHVLWESDDGALHSEPAMFEPAEVSILNNS
jgi:hypothetical protein